jgi:hypothetical protein
MHIGGDVVLANELNAIDSDEAKRSRDTIKSYLWNYIIH